VADLSIRRPGFAPGSDHVPFMAGRVDVGQAFLRLLRVSSVSTIPSWFSTLVYHVGDVGGRSSETHSYHIDMINNKEFHLTNRIILSRNRKQKQQLMENGI
jgi:hypothetical protein